MSKAEKFKKNAQKFNADKYVRDQKALEKAQKEILKKCEDLSEQGAFEMIISKFDETPDTYQLMIANPSMIEFFRSDDNGLIVTQGFESYTLSWNLPDPVVEEPTPQPEPVQPPVEEPAEEPKPIPDPIDPLVDQPIIDEPQPVEEPINPPSEEGTGDNLESEETPVEPSVIPESTENGSDEGRIVDEQGIPVPSEQRSKTKKK